MNRYAFVSYTGPKEIIDLSFEVTFEDELKFLSNHIEDTPIMQRGNDKFVRRKSGKKSRRRLRKMKNKLERIRTKITKRLTSPISPLKRAH